MKRFCIYILTSVLLMCLLVPVGFSQEGPSNPPFYPWPYYSGKNSIIAVTPTSPCSGISITSDAAVAYEDNGSGIVCVQYVDGLGRVAQESVLHTRDNENLTSCITYDSLGREYRKWLPLPNNETGGFVSDFESAATTLYGSAPYTETVWEHSPLNRELGERGPNEYYTHPASVSYLINSANEIKRFVVSSSGVKGKGFYPKGALTKVYQSDPDGIKYTRYADGLGRVVAECTANTAYTYYVYNDLGQLAYVIPPVLYDKMQANGSYADTCADMRKYAYVYKYDNRGNVESKRLPGCDPIYLVYDKGNRLVMTQDGNQRTRGFFWTVNKYDSINRPIYTFEVEAGECSSLAAAQQICTPLNFIETYFPNGDPVHHLTNTGYSRDYFHAHPMHIFTVNYYDDYTFLNRISGYASNLSSHSVTGYDAVTNGSVKGLLTGQRVYSLQDGTCTYIAYYYDNRGRLVQQRSYNALGGYDYTYYALTFTGKPQKMLTQQIFSNITTTEEYNYKYDNQERLIASRYKLNDDPVMQLDSFVYDEIGRVAKKYLLDKIDSVCYTYNIRSQITKLKSSGFEENLYYATLPTFSSVVSNFGDKSYNGNVSVGTWTYGNKTNGYIYYYDSYNRLFDTYGILDAEWADGLYSESFAYDKQGNIRYLYRWDSSDMMNYLSMSYDGNQLVKVTDNGYGPIDYSEKRYQDGANEQKEMFYDKNGALIADFDRKICTIRNNVLSLPDTLQFTNGNQIVHHYDAMGNRLRTTYYTRKVALVEPATNTIPGTDNLQEYNMVSYITLGNKRYVRYGHDGWGLQYVYNPEGYIKYWGEEEHYPYYYIKDHLGSVRETYIRPYVNEKYCEQRMQYYPSGLPWNTNLSPSYQPFKYGGKEFVEMHGLDEYDSEARWYYPAIMRTTTMDPMCEDYYSISPYAWCGNNPVNFVDPDGRFVEVTKTTDSTYIVQNGMPNKDLTVYVVNEKGERTGEVLGEMLTPYSFFDDNGDVIKGAIVNIKSSDGQAFFDKLVRLNPDILTYMKNAVEKGVFDYKNIGGEGLSEQELTLHHYRGSVSADGKIVSARDWGNMGAGWIAGKTNLSWPIARLGFDGYQTIQVSQKKDSNYIIWQREKAPTRKAEWVGYKIGLSNWIERMIYGK